MSHLLDYPPSSCVVAVIISAVATACTGSNSGGGESTAGLAGSVAARGGNAQVNTGGGTALTSTGGAGTTLAVGSIVSTFGGAVSSDAGGSTSVLSSGNRTQGGAAIGGTPSNGGASATKGGSSNSAETTRGSGTRGGASSGTGGVVAKGGTDSAGAKSGTGGSISIGGSIGSGGAAMAGAAGAILCATVGGGTCPATDLIKQICPGSMLCGCYIVPDLGANKKSLLDGGASLPATDQPYVQFMLAAAMGETEKLTADYSLGDNKKGDSFSVGTVKQNWMMMRQCHPAWQGLTSEDYMTATAINSDHALDAQVYVECRKYFGDKWWGGQRNGTLGLANPDTLMIQEYKSQQEWAHRMIQSDPNGNSHFCDDVRMWIQRKPEI